MYAKIQSHDASFSTSSKSAVEYLSKENGGLGKFFSHDYTFENQREFNARETIDSLDENRGRQNLRASNYYMLTLSPSKKELAHIEKLAEHELNSRGFSQRIMYRNEQTKQLYLEQKEAIIVHYLKVYTQDVMKVYAKSFDASVYTDQDNLPNSRQLTEINKVINKRVNDEIEKLGLLDLEMKDNYVNSTFNASENKESRYVTVKVDEAKDKGTYYEFTLEDKRLTCSKNYCVLDKENLTIQEARLEHYKEEYQKKVAAREKPIELEKSQCSFETFNYKGEEKTVCKISINHEKLGEIKLSFDSTTYNIEKDKVAIPTYNYIFQYNKEVNKVIDNTKELIEVNIKNEEWIKRGFNPEKREITDKDLMYYATVENSRHYKRTNEADRDIIDHNKDILTKIESDKTLSEKDKRELLQELIKDKHTNEVIKEGAEKGGNNKHIHVLVSRHDATTKDKKLKITLSPMNNSREGHNGIPRGFNRSEFFKNVERTFDQKLEYKRQIEHSFTPRDEQKNGLLVSNIRGELKGQIGKYLGINEVKTELDPRSRLGEIKPLSAIKKEMAGLPIPTSFPKGKLDAVIKIAKAIAKALSQEQSY